MGCKRFRAKERKRVKFRGNQFTQKAVNKEDADRTNEGTPPCQTSRPRVVSGIMEHLREKLDSSPQFKTNLATLGISN